MDTLVVVLYLAVLGSWLSTAHRGLLLYLYWRHRKHAPQFKALFSEPCW